MHLCGVGASDGGGRIVGALGSPCGAIAGAMGYGLWVMGMGYGHGWICKTAHGRNPQSKIREALTGVRRVTGYGA